MTTVMSEMSDEKKDDRRTQLIELLASGETLETASQTVGVTSRTVRRWRDADPEFADLVADAMCHTDDEVERVTLANCLDPDPSHNSLRMFWLKSRRPEVYRETVKSTVETTTSITIDATVRKAATDELELWRKQMIETLSSSRNASPMPLTSPTPTG